MKISTRIEKLVPILQIARPEEAKVIPEIFNDAYKGTYPYKEFTDVQEVREMINDPCFHWILFKLDNGEIAGCYGFHINLEEKSGTFHGFALKRKYQRHISTLKIIIGATFAIFHAYKDKILVWSCEVRTGHTVTQYMTAMCGINPVAFFPNKDIFFHQRESTLMVISYDERALQEYHRKDRPHIISKAMYCHPYAKIKYNIPEAHYHIPIKIDLDQEKLNALKKSLQKEIKPYKISYEKVTFSFEGSDSFFEFLFTPHILNCDRTQYKVESLEELYVFVQEVKTFIKKHKVRYFEVFVTAYDPLHQQLFYKAGLLPRGYVPCWKYNKETGLFEDYIAFNYYKGKIENIQIIPTSDSLLSALGFSIDLESQVVE